jgi:hypothetical protein
MRYFGLLFMWMKYYHISKNELLYKKINDKIVKYSWIFYLLKLLYPVWLVFGLFTGKWIYMILSIMGLIKYFIYPLIRGKVYRWYELIEAIISIILYIMLSFNV